MSDLNATPNEGAREAAAAGQSEVSAVEHRAADLRPVTRPPDGPPPRIFFLRASARTAKGRPCGGAVAASRPPI